MENSLMSLRQLINKAIVNDFLIYVKMIICGSIKGVDKCDLSFRMLFRFILF